MSPPLHMTQQYHLASMAAWLIAHHDLLPHILSIRFSAVNSSPHPGIAPQSLNSSSQPLRLPGDQRSCLGRYGCCKDCLILIPFHLCHRSAVSFSALSVSPLTQTIAPMWGSIPASVSPPAEGRSSPTNTPVFPASSFILLSFAWFYIFFSTIRYSCLCSAGVLHAVLCLKVYS